MFTEEGNANAVTSGETSLIAPGDHVPILVAIASMIHNGVDFCRTRDCWSFGEDSVSLNKSFSVYFTLNTPVVHNNSRLSVYGMVLPFRCDLAADSIFNGVCTARMRIERAIPSTVRINREFVLGPN